MGISVIPNLLEDTPTDYVFRDGKTTIGDIVGKGKYYRHPDSASIAYPLVVEKPLGSINKPLNIAIVGGGAAGIAAYYELSNLSNSSDYINVTIYESDPENFIHFEDDKLDSITTQGFKAGRVSAAVSSDKPGGTDHAVYEIGAMRFPEIAGLMWHYVGIVYGYEADVEVFPNPGTVPTEFVHGDRVDRFGKSKEGKIEWLDKCSPTKQVVDIVRSRLFGSMKGADTSLFPIAGQDPAKLHNELKNPEISDEKLARIYKQWKHFATEYDERTLESAVREIIEKSIGRLPDIKGLVNDAEKINHYVELFGAVGFGTGSLKPMFNMSLIEMMRLLLWDYTNEYLLPKEARVNANFIRDIFRKAQTNNPKVEVKKARVCDVGHLDGDSKGDAIVVSYAICGKNNTESCKPQAEVYDFVILATTPRQTSHMIRKIGFNNVARRVTLGDFDRPLEPKDVRPALILSNESETVNSKIYTALDSIHMVSSSKIFATVKRSEFEEYSPNFLEQGKIKAVVSDCGLGSSYVVPTVPSTIPKEDSKDYYSFLISYAWEDITQKLQHQFGQYPLNIHDTELLMKSVINRTVRDIKNPLNDTVEPWWFGNVMSKTTLEDPLCYDWTTFSSSGAFKLDNAGDYYNIELLFRYHTHALKPELKNKFFLANCSYSHLGGWIEGAFMSAVNAVCGLIVAANGGDINALNPEARKVVANLDNVVENGQ